MIVPPKTLGIGSKKPKRSKSIYHFLLPHITILNTKMCSQFKSQKKNVSFNINVIDVSFLQSSKITENDVYQKRFKSFLCDSKNH